MNTTMRNQDDDYQDLLGGRIVARLNASTTNLPHDIAERLKAARSQALGKRKVVKLELASGLAAGSNSAALHMDDGHFSLWTGFASFLPLVALVVGLLVIGAVQEQNQAAEVAEVDAELLTDALPPEAFTDPGFLTFLSAKRQD